MSEYKRSAETRQKIIDATIKLIRKNGYASLNIKSIGDELGMPRSLIYYYYSNKEDILLALYRIRFSDVHNAVVKATKNEENPMIRLLLGYLMFSKFLLHDPLFTEFILNYPTFATLGGDALNKTIDEFYDDSREAFRYYGLPLNGDLLKEHVITIDALARALNQGIYNGSFYFTEEEMMTYLCERTIMITFNLTKQEMSDFLSHTFELAKSIKSIRSTYIM